MFLEIKKKEKNKMKKSMYTWDDAISEIIDKVDSRPDGYEITDILGDAIYNAMEKIDDTLEFLVTMPKRYRDISLNDLSRHNSGYAGLGETLNEFFYYFLYDAINNEVFKHYD